MNCPNCGVYNPEERKVCWRCDQELPKPKEPKKKPQGLTASRMWLLVGIAIVLWVLITFVLPLLLRGMATP